MNITIVYQSRKGKTAAYARAIAMYLWQKGLNISLCASSDFKPEKLQHCDCLMLGCWTSGWFVIRQHPNSIWTQFAEKHLQTKLPHNLVLFTTYKIRTGSLFKKMCEKINTNGVSSIHYMKSKTGILSEEDKIALDDMVNNIPLKTM